MIPSKARPIPNPAPLPKLFATIDTQNYRNDEVHDGNQHQENPPPGSTDNLAPDIEIIDWDDTGPAGLAGFREHFPHRHDQEQRDEQSDDHRSRAARLALAAVVVFDLREQQGVMEKEVFCELNE